MDYIQKFYLRILLLICFSIFTIFPQKKLIIGAYGSTDSLNSFDTTSALSFRINTKLHSVLRSQKDSWLTYTGGQNWGNNIPALSAFSSAAAGSLTASWIADSLRINGLQFSSDWLRNFDWIYYFSSAYHKTWEAYKPDTSMYQLDLRHHAGKDTLINGVYYWTNRNAPINAEIIYGPSNWYPYPTNEIRGYAQDTRYRGSGNFWKHDTIYYKVNFYLRRLAIVPPLPESSLGDTICNLKVKVHYSYFGVLKDTVFSRTVKASEISTTTSVDKYIGYDLAFVDNNSTLLRYTNNDSAKISFLGTEFIVENRTTTHLYAVEKIDVSDQWIWKTYFVNTAARTYMKNELTSYLTALRTDFPGSPSFYDNKLDYAFSIDEPHSVDSHDAIRVLQESLIEISSQGLGGLVKTPKLFIHFYPEWNGYRNNEFIPNRFIKEVKPDPFVYYYHYQREDPFNLTNRNLHNILEQLDDSTKSKGFLFTIDVWDQRGFSWCSPSKQALSSAIMLNLSFGCKGIIYEPFYSYGSVKALVKYESGSYQPTYLGYFVRDSINTRLAGKFGTTLANLKYSGDRIYLRNMQDTLGNVTNQNVGEHFSIGNISQNGYFLVSMLKTDSLPNSKYLLVSNLESEDSTSKNFKFELNGNVFAKSANLSIKEIEGNKINKVINNLQGVTDTLSIVLSAGEGSLLRVSPIVETGGKIINNGDTVRGITTLEGDTLFITSGKKLDVENDYILRNNLVLDSGAVITGMGYLLPAEGVKVKTKNWKNSLFRGKANGKVKLIWADYPGTGTVNKYKVYRSKGTPVYQLIGSVWKDTLFYYDTTTTANNYSGSMQLFASYFLVAEVNRNGRTVNDSTTDIGYYEIPSSGGPGGIEKKGSKTTKVYSWRLAQNYPNPFNPVTIINYEIAVEGRVILKLYDILGSEIRTIVDEEKAAGEYQVTLDVSSLPSGIYIYRLESGKFNHAKKLILLK